MLYTFFRTFASRKEFEECYYVDAPSGLDLEAMKRIRWLLERPDATVTLSTQVPEGTDVLEIGPRLNIETAFSSNAVRICENMGVSVQRIEMSRRFIAVRDEHVVILARECDRMTETFYANPLTTFDTGIQPEPVRFIDILGEGEDALREANRELGLGMDDTDIAHWTAMFRTLGRNPTDVELFQIGNGNSEHSRHWFFKGRIVIDGVAQTHTLLDMIREPWQKDPGTNIIAFNDNAGVFRGNTVSLLLPERPGKPSRYYLQRVLVHLAITAETHNHPTMWEPFEGAATGSGGCIRDKFAVGRGALVSFGGAGYCVGNLHVPGYEIPGEETGHGQTYATFASPSHILVRGSDGVSDYGNKIGEPLIGGFCRSFGQVVGDNRTEFLKPVLYAAGMSFVPDASIPKGDAEIGLVIVRIGGPAYRVGVGGGSGSSVEGGTARAELDFKSVQRGNAEMENRVNRVIRACVEMLEKNPIVSIHDQGAGGPSNVLTELMEPLGGRVEIRNIVAGDKTMSVLELWVAEFQEGYGLLVREKDIGLLQAICEREQVNCEVLGVITGDGSVVVTDAQDGTTPVHLSLRDVLGELPQKTFEMQRLPQALEPLRIPDDLTVEDAARMVFAQVGVGSKKHLTDKVDRSVTGLVVRQQHCGPMQIPVADCGVVALSHFDTVGMASAYGENPLVMLIDPAKGARRAVAEAMLNMAGTRISARSDIEFRANWMWAAKQPGQGPRLHDAMVALSDFACDVGIRANGGKDSLSMSAKVGDETVLSPGTLVIKAAALVPDIERVCTPDLKEVGSRIGYLQIGDGDGLGGSALAQALGQLGNDCADVQADVLATGFDAIQQLIERGFILSCHDVSDGGLFTAIAEMCLAGNIGAYVQPMPYGDPLAYFFGERTGIVFEFDWRNQTDIQLLLEDAGLWDRFRVLGSTTGTGKLVIGHGEDTPLYKATLPALRELWERTSMQLKLLQLAEGPVLEEEASFSDSRTPLYRLTFEPPRPAVLLGARPLVAVIREEGSNGDTEMRAAFTLAGFTAIDVNMHDIRTGAIDSLAAFKVAAFVGGFSYADVFGSATGWAAGIRFNPRAQKVFADFFARSDTYSLMICNGCQLGIRLGIVPYPELSDAERPWMEHNLSRKFESRYPRIRIEKSESLWLRGMEGSIVGVHSAHGEGNFTFHDPRTLERVQKGGLIAAVYADADGNPTERYPYNPNGSVGGIAALCTPNGRHLAMMPHPERTVLPWQQAYIPPGWRHHPMAPLFRMFTNIRGLCD